MVRGTIESGEIVVGDVTLVHGLVALRFFEDGPMRFATLDFDDTELGSFGSADLRLSGAYDGPPPSPAPDGTPVMWRLPVRPGLRFSTVTHGDDGLLVKLDLGPVLVAECGVGALPADLCATFDSDGDGCRDDVDPDPLVPETEPPVVHLSATPNTLWPPNHLLVDVQASVAVTDNCDKNPRLVLHSITSNESDEGLGDGDFPLDVQGASPGELDEDFRLRSERSGRGDGRVYTIRYEAMDRAGNRAVAEAEVVVPRSLEPRVR
jgi:hypothetical protein